MIDNGLKKKKKKIFGLWSLKKRDFIFQADLEKGRDCKESKW